MVTSNPPPKSFTGFKMGTLRGYFNSISNGGQLIINLHTGTLRKLPTRCGWAVPSSGLIHDKVKRFKFRSDLHAFDRYCRRMMTDFLNLSVLASSTSYYSEFLSSIIILFFKKHLNTMFLPYRTMFLVEVLSMIFVAKIVSQKITFLRADFWTLFFYLNVFLTETRRLMNNI